MKYTRAELEEMSVIQMAAGIDVAMPSIAGRDADPMMPEARERRAYTRRLARAAFQVIPNFALDLDRSEEPTPSPTGTELALEEAKRHIERLTAFFMENPGWVAASNEARAFVAGVPVSPRPEVRPVVGSGSTSDLETRITGLESLLSDSEEENKRLREALTEFVSHYPHGVNPYLDKAYNLARSALVKGK